MSSNLNLRPMRQRMAKATVQGMRAPAAVAIKRQIIGHAPAGFCDPMEVPDC